MMYSVTDVAGINRISEQVLANAAHALAGMIAYARPAEAAAETRPAIGLTMFGVTTPCVQAVTQAARGPATTAWSSTPPAPAASRWRSWSIPACWPA